MLVGSTLAAEAYSELCQISIIEFLAKIVNGIYLIKSFSQKAFKDISSAIFPMHSVFYVHSCFFCGASLEICSKDYISNIVWILSFLVEKQPFADVFRNRCSSKFCNIHSKTTPVLESLFKKVAGLKASNFIKKRYLHVFSCECCKIFKNTFINRTPPVDAPVRLNFYCISAEFILNFFVIRLYLV